MAYVIAQIAEGEGDDDETVILNVLSTDEGALIFAHKVDAEDFLDVADVDVEMHVIEKPEGVTGVEVV